MLWSHAGLFLPVQAWRLDKNVKLLIISLVYIQGEWQNFCHCLSLNLCLLKTLHSPLLKFKIRSVKVQICLSQSFSITFSFTIWFIKVAINKTIDSLIPKQCSTFTRFSPVGGRIQIKGQYLHRDTVFQVHTRAVSYCQEQFLNYYLACFFNKNKLMTKFSWFNL